MARDKQLIVRVSEADREAFNQLCHAQDIGASTVLNIVIERVLSGALSLDMLLGKSESVPLDYVSKSELMSAIASLREDFAGVIQAALAPLLARLEAVEEITARPVTLEPVDHGQQKESPTAIANGEGITLSDLARHSGIAKSTLFRNANEGLEHFTGWILKNKKNPDKEAWTFEGEGDDRRFYRIN